MALAATPLRPGALATGELRLIGLQLKAPTETIQAPLGAPLLIPVQLYLGDRPATAAEISALVPVSARLTGTLTGPNFASLDLIGDPRTGISVPGLPHEGDFTLQNLRIVDGTRTLFESNPPTVAIHCLGEVLITSVTSSPMTMQELRDAGVQVGQGNYEARRFTMALTVGSQQVDLSIPVAIPVYNGLEEPLGSAGIPEKLELTGLTQLVPGLNVGVMDFAPGPTFNLEQRPEIAHMLRYAFKGVIVIPGSIGYLHQFYKTNVVALNALPSGSPFVVNNLKATFLPPVGADGAPGTTDDPLRAVAAQNETADPAKDLKVAGTGLTRIAAGESASATWVLEGMKEGAHDIRFALQGQFEGPGLQAPIPIQGTARGKILVRNPTFSLSLVHPDVVRQGETYTLEARLTNTSQTIANSVSITLDQARLVNVRLVGAGSGTVDTLQPGESHTFSFRLKALRTGEVQSSYLYMESGTIGFQLTTGLGERSIKLSPDTLILPQNLDDLPAALREALLRVLGQAHSIATNRGALPAGVLPIRANTFSTDLAPGLNEAGLFLRMGMSRTRVLDDLWRLFNRSRDAGFDQLMRTTEAGAEFRSAWLQAYRGWANASPDPSTFLTRDPAMMQAPAYASVENAEGLFLGWTSEAGQILSANSTLLAAPWGTVAREGQGVFAQMPMGSAGSRIVLENPTAVGRTVGLKVAGPFGTPFRLRHAGYHFDLPAGARATLDLAGQESPVIAIQTTTGTSQASAEALADLQEEPFQALAVHRYDLGLTASATPFGTHVVVLFNKPLKELSIPEGIEGHNQASALVQVEANAFWKKAMPKGGFLSDEIIHFPPALVQATPRILSCYLEKPVGPYITRNLTLSPTIRSISNAQLAGTLTWPVACSDFPGGSIVRGKIRKPSGLTLPGGMSFWYMVKPEEGGVDLKTGTGFKEDYYALVSSFRSEADGSFQLDYIPEPAKTATGPFLLAARTDSGMAAGEASPLGRGGLIEMDLVLEGRGTLEGTVKDAAGQPVAGAQVQVLHDGSGYSKTFGGGAGGGSGTTDLDGKFKFEHLQVGGYSIRVMKGVQGLASNALVPHDGAVTHVDLVLGQAMGTVRVKVLNSDGTVRPNQLVFLGLPGLIRDGGSPFFIFAMSAETDANGYALFNNVPAGDVRAKIPGVADPVPLWDGLLNPGATLEGLLRMVDPETRAVVEVVVKDRHGVPVQNAYAWVDQWHTQFPAGHTDADGVLLIPTTPNVGFSVTVLHRDFPATGAHSQQVVPISGERVLLPVTMPARAFVKGKVTRPDGTLIKKALVALPPIGGSALTEHFVYTDEQGQYRLGGVDPSKAQRLTVVGPDLLTAANRTVQGAEDEELLVDLVVPEVGQNILNGTTYQPTESDQRIPTMAYVQAYGELPSLQRTDLGIMRRTFMGERLTSTDGRFSFGPLPSGPFELTASSDQFPRLVRATGTFAGAHETKTVDLFLQSTDTASLEGLVYRPDGQTPAGAGLRVMFLPNLNATTEAIEVLTDANGRYAFPKVLPVSPSYVSRYLRVEDPATGLITVIGVVLDQPRPFLKNVRLFGKGKLTVRLQDSQGRALTDGDVTLMHSLGSILRPADLPPLQERLRPEHLGTLVFEGLLEGQIRAEVTTPTNLRGVASAAIPEGGGDAEVVVRLQPMGAIQGMLKRADGTPVPAGRIDAYRNGAWIGVSPSRQEGVDGKFLFPALPSGTIYLRAWDPDTRQAGEATVQLPDNGSVVMDLVLQDRGPVVVTVKKEGQPLVNATVSLVFQGGIGGFQDVQSATNAAGTCTFEIPPGSFRVTATDPITLAMGQNTFTRRNGDPALATEIQVQATRHLLVTVQAPTGYTGSLQGWRVGSSSGRSANLDAGGTALLRDLPLGSHQLTLSDTRNLYRGSRSATLTLEGGTTQNSNLQALARAQMRVFLKDANGAAVEGGVQLFGVDGDGHRWASAEATLGQFRLLDVLQGSRSLKGQSLDGRLQTFGSAIVATEGETVVANLTLEATAGFRGVLKDALDRVVPFVEVRYSRVGGTSLMQNLTLATDAQGVFQASGLPLGTYAISAHQAGRAGSRSVVLSSADQLVTADFSLSPAGDLHGVVTDPLRPIGAVKVSVFSGNARLAESVVESSGAYAFWNLPAAAPLRVEATMDDGMTNAYSGPVTIPGEGVDHVFNFTLQARPSLAGKTFAVDGSTARPMGLELWVGNSLIRRAGTSADHPTFRFKYLVPGTTYELRGFDDTVFLNTASMTLQASPETQVLDLAARAQRELRVRLVNANGTPAALTGNVRLILQEGSRPTWNSVFDATGNATIPGVLLGTYRAELSNIPGQPPIAHTFVVPAGTGPLSLDLALIRTGTMLCRAKTQAGRIFTGTSVTVRDYGTGRTWPAVLQPDGAFRVEGVYVDRTLQVTYLGFPLIGENARWYTLTTPDAETEYLLVGPNFGTLQGQVLNELGLPVSGAEVKVPIYMYSPRATTDAGGRYAIRDLALDGSLRYFQATLPGRVDHAIGYSLVDQDGEVVDQDLRFPGLGTVEVKVLDRFNAPVANQLVTLTTGSLVEPTRTATTDGSGIARFASVMVAPVTAKTTLPGGLVTTTGTLLLNQTLNLQLKGVDMGSVSGRIRRANPANVWPAGTQARIKGVLVPMAADGTLQPVGTSLDFAYTTTPFTIEAQVPGGPWISFGTSTLIQNGDRVLDLTAPVFGSLMVTVLKTDGTTPAASASVRLDGTNVGTTNALGQWTTLYLTAGSHLLSAGLGTQTARVSLSITQDGQALTPSLTLTDYLEVSGTYATYGSSAYDLLLFQDGNVLSGTWYRSSRGRYYAVTGTIQGTAASLNIVGEINPTDTGTATLTFASDGLSFTGTNTLSSSFNGTRRAGVVTVKVEPTLAALRPGETLALRAKVAGVVNKAVTWSMQAANAGTVDAAGLYTAPATPVFAYPVATLVSDPAKTGKATLHVTTDGRLDYSGTWRNPNGDIVQLAQDETRLFGPAAGYSWKNQFSGNVVGPLYSFDWSQVTSSNRGRGVWTFNEDLTAYTEVWGYNASTTDGGTSSGTRQPNLAIIFEPKALVLTAGATAAIRAHVIGHPDKRVTWTASGGQWDAEGRYQAPVAAGVYSLEATSVFDPAVKATLKVVVTDGNPGASLVGRWTFEEGSGTSAQDVSGHGLHGTLNDTVAWIEGRVGQGQALQFNGFTSNMSVPNTAALNPSSLALAMWLYLPADLNCSTGDNWRWLAHKGTSYGYGTVSGYFVILTQNGRIQWSTSTGTPDHWWPTGAILPVGAWTHVVLSFDAATGLKQAFVNGVLVDSKLTPPAPLAANTSPLVINNPATSACTSGNGHFDGAMDDLRLYNRSLSQAEVAELFAPIALSPRQISLTPLGTTAFQAALSGSQTAPLTWGTSGGSITPDGAYTAPTQPGLYTVTASAALAPSKPGVAMVYVRDYDASEEFSISQNPAGTWSYGWSTSLGGGFTPFSTPQVAPTGVAYWTASGIGSLGIYYNGTDRVVTPYGSTNYLPNQLAMHPGPSGQYSLLRWTAPESGSFDIRAAFKALDPQPATTDVHVLLNGISKFDGMVNSVLTGPVYTGTLAVQAGDKVDIAVGYGNGYYGYDSTAVSVRINRVVPTVVVTPGHVLLAPAATKAFQATVAGLPSTGVVWTVEEGSIGGSISSEGLYTAPAAPGVFHVVATSAADGSVLGKATVVVE